jgi:hypothetical protein
MTPRQAVVSSLLVSVHYTPEAVLEVVLQGERRYKYFEVPPHVYQSLLSAESKGAYFNRFVKGRFPYQRLSD